MTTAPAPARRTPAGDTGSGVHATARVQAVSNGRATTLPLLHGDGPFHLRRLRPRGGRARVCVIGAMSAPLGGDRLAIDVTVGDRADLEITTAAATLALRGATTDHATYHTSLRVGDRAGLRWLPRPLISACGSNLRQTCAVDLAPTARLLLREEQILGRAAEPPGDLTTRLTVRRDGRPLLDQHTAIGTAAPGWDGPAVLAGHRVTGQLLIVDPRLEEAPVQPHLLGNDPAQGQGALVPLTGPAVLITALAPTTVHLHRLLDHARSLVPLGL
ncbi:urease accessory protein UreD [Streptomyces verrucosisporus]|uniref:urease accessory protein UreD n=1 Tax=Streptomyces verrucosisporus TaxID=1695161 RepID=UPI0019D1D26B|nr:urease accessory protein UreD [Streptomyces verrucosisporus]MBN3928926.1 urease accessory protein UreD [Streptomyces verrucosisporus]